MIHKPPQDHTNNNICRNCKYTLPLHTNATFIHHIKTLSGPKYITITSMDNLHAKIQTLHKQTMATKHRLRYMARPNPHRQNHIVGTIVDIMYHLYDYLYPFNICNMENMLVTPKTNTIYH